METWPRRLPISTRPWKGARPSTAFGHALSSVKTEETRPPCPAGERDGLVEVVVAHDGGNRPESLDVVDRGPRHRVGGVEQDRVQEGALLGIARTDAHLVGVARDDFRLRLQFADPRPHLPAGPGWRAAPCASPRSPAPRGRSCPGGRPGRRSGVRDARGAMTRRIAVHFWPAFTSSRGRLPSRKVELGRARDGVGPEDRGVEAVGLHCEADGLSTIAGCLLACARSRPTR